MAPLDYCAVPCLVLSCLTLLGPDGRLMVLGKYVPRQYISAKSIFVTEGVREIRRCEPLTSKEEPFFKESASDGDALHVLSLVPLSCVYEMERPCQSAGFEFCALICELPIP